MIVKEFYYLWIKLLAIIFCLCYRFIYTLLGIGVTLCVVTWLGHIAAETVNGCCLYLVSFYICIIIYMNFLLCSRKGLIYAYGDLIFYCSFDVFHILSESDSHYCLYGGVLSRIRCNEFIVDLNCVQYMLFVILFLMLEAVVTADVFLNPDWEEVSHI